MSAMKTTVELEWKGKEVKVQGQKAINKSAFEIGLIVEGQAKLLCPVDLGYLAASITTASFDNSTEVENPAKYNGTSNITLGAKKQARFVTTDIGRFEKITKSEDDNEVLVGTVVEYGPHVEFGTIKSKAQPFLRPALDLAMGKTLTILEKNGRFYFQEYLQ